MSERVLGTCSICGGAVTVPLFWLGIIPPTPSCSSCGATPVHAHGPVIPMRRQSWQTWQPAPPIWQPIHWEPVHVTPSLPMDSTGLPVDWDRRNVTIS